MQIGFIAALAAAPIMLFSGVVSANAQTTKVEKFYDNWKVECRDDGKSKRCFMNYALLNPQNRNIVFSWTIVPDRDNAGQDKAIIRTPTGVLLPEGLSVSFASGSPVKAAYRTCRRNRCLSEFPLTNDWMSALGSQNEMTVKYKTERGRDISRKITLQKFSEAYEFYRSEKGN